MDAKQRGELLTVLKEHEAAFTGTRGKWNGKEMDLELKDDAKPYYGKPYQIPQAYRELVRQEVDRLEKEGVLSKVKSSERAAPCFVIPKKDMTIRFLTDFRGLNKNLKRKPWPIPLIQDILQSMTDFRWATTLDLNMGYYAMGLNAKARKLCVISLPWGVYAYNTLPMGLLVATVVFQEAMGG